MNLLFIRLNCAAGHQLFFLWGQIQQDYALVSTYQNSIILVYHHLNVEAIVDRKFLNDLLFLVIVENDISVIWKIGYALFLVFESGC